MNIPFKPQRGYRIICETPNGSETFIINSLLDEEEEPEYVSLLYSCQNTSSNLRIVFYDYEEELYRVNGDRNVFLGNDYKVLDSRNVKIY